MTTKCTSRVLGRPGQSLLGALAVAGGLCLLGCGEDPQRKGEIVLAVSTDMAIDADLDRVDVIVQRENGKVYSQTVDLYPTASGLFTPGTYAIVAGDKDNETVKVSLVARRKNKTRLVRELVTTLPKSRVAMVPMPLQWLCEGNANTKGDHSECYGDAKDKDETCNLGRCAGSEVDSSELEDLDLKQLYAGYETAEEAAANGACFDVVRCFDGGEPVDVDLDDCSFKRPSGAKQLNVGMVVSGDGHCNEASGVCYIALDQSKAYGWRDGDGTIKLPPGVCDRLGKQVLAVVATNDCKTKTLSVPTCGPWLAAPTSNDRDGDGIEDAKDNCPDEPNPKQQDADGDGIGDACDFAVSIEDRDRDSVADDEDNCPDVANKDQRDTDGVDGGDACDEDDDNDGFLDEEDPEPRNEYVPDPDRDGLASDEDNCPATANEDQLDTDDDGQGDACDTDDDGDGVKDKLDNCELVSNSDQADCDNDGQGNACETCPSEITITQPRGDRVLDSRVFQIAGDVGTLDLTELAVHSESNESGRTFDQTIAVNDGSFESENLILSAGENQVWAETCNCRSEPLLLTADVNPADILVTLTWDQDATDADLYLYEPGAENNICYFDALCAEPDGETALGAILDTDNTEGFGPENYTLSTAAGDTLASGLYRVRVHYFEGAPEINYQVRVLLNENSEEEQVSEFDGSLSTSNNDQSDPYQTGEDWADVAEIVCSGEPVRCSVREPQTDGFQGTGGADGNGGSVEPSSAGADGVAGSSDVAGGTGGSSEATGGLTSDVGTGGTGGSSEATGGLTSDVGTGGTGGSVEAAGGASAGTAGVFVATGGVVEATGGVQSTGGLSETGGVATGGADIALAGTAGSAGAQAGAGGGGGADGDADGDGVLNGVDNCPMFYTELGDQTDTDNDGVGDACECSGESYYDFTTEDCRACSGSPGNDQITLSAVRFGPGSLTQYDPATHVFSFELDPRIGELSDAYLTVTAYKYDNYGSLLVGTATATRIDRNVIYFDLSNFAFDNDQGTQDSIDTVGIGAVVLNVVHTCDMQSTIREIVAEIEPETGATWNLRPQQCVEDDTLGRRVGSPDGEYWAWDGSTEHLGADHIDTVEAVSSECMAVAPDVSLSWTAPADGTYAFWVNSEFAASIALLDSTCREQLACSSQSFEAAVTGGQQIVIVIGSQSPGEYGPVSLYIQPPSP